MEDQSLECKLKFEILISTMDKTSLSFLNPIFRHHKQEDLSILIINQTEVGNELHSDIENIRVINSFERGLSLSRNLAIQNARGDICLIADDDIEYLPNFESIVKSAFKKFNKATVIRFKIDTFTGETYKTYPIRSTKLFKKRDIKNSSSIEIALIRTAIVSNNITFDSLFGLGSYFQSGEEYLFLKDVLKKNLHIYFENKSIVKHKFTRSTSNMASNAFIKAQGAIYYKDYKLLSYIALLKFIIFLLRKQMIFLSDFKNKFKIGLDGISSYKRLKHDKL
ncbi:glycosyltransferase [Flavobacteriaceae bacterium LMO-SS05]